MPHKMITLTVGKYSKSNGRKDERQKYQNKQITSQLQGPHVTSTCLQLRRARCDAVPVVLTSCAVTYCCG